MKTHVSVRIPVALDARLEFRFPEFPGKTNASNRVLAALRAWANDRGVPLDGIPAPDPARSSTGAASSRSLYSRRRPARGRRRR